MASITVASLTRFPEGTVLTIYADNGVPPNLQGPPIKAALGTATVTSGSATFPGLADNTNYWIGASVSGTWLYLGCATTVGTTTVTATAEVHDDFTQAGLGNFTSRTADSGQAYVVTGDTVPKIEEINGRRVLSIANAVAAGNHSTYLQLPLTRACRYAFAKVMFGSVGTTLTSSVALATPSTSIATTPDPNYDIGVHGVFSASGGLDASSWVDMVPQTTSDLDGSNLFGSAAAPAANTPVWCGWVLCENGTLLILAPDGTVTQTRDTRYLINSGLFAWLEPYLTAGNTDVRPYVLEWHAGCSIGEAAAALGGNKTLGAVIFAAQKIQADLGRNTRGDKATDAATAANTTETDLHSFTLSGGTLGANGDKLVAKFAFTTAANANTKRIRVYFGGIVVWDSTAAVYNGIHGAVEITVIRVSATTFRVIATGLLGVNVTLATYTAVTATAAASQILKITGLNGTAAASDIVARLSTWEKAHAA
jgi:hypothetical protein